MPLLHFFILLLISFPAWADPPEVATFITHDKVTITFDHYVPAAKSGRGVLLLHMLGQNRGDWKSFAMTLRDKNVGVMAIDFRGHGSSLQKNATPIFYRDFSRADWMKLVDDVGFAVAEMKRLGYSSIAIAGASIGANAAISYASRDKTIRAIALLSPGWDYRGITIEDGLKIYSGPLWIAASQEDTYAAESSKKAFNIASQPGARKSILLLNNRGHGTRMLSDEGCFKKLVAFLAGAVQ